MKRKLKRGLTLDEIDVLKASLGLFKEASYSHAFVGLPEEQNLLNIQTVDSVIQKIESFKGSLNADDLRVMLASLSYLFIYLSDSEKTMKSTNPLFLDSRRMKSIAQDLFEEISDWLHEAGI